jgi:hypothetical protein
VYWDKVPRIAQLVGQSSVDPPPFPLIISLPDNVAASKNLLPYDTALRIDYPGLTMILALSFRTNPPYLSLTNPFRNSHYTQGRYFTTDNPIQS